MACRFTGYFYLLPGSRHLYGKDFRKIVYMHMINVLSGVQVCLVSLKVGGPLAPFASVCAYMCVTPRTWISIQVQLARLFPEDMADDEELSDDDNFVDPAHLAHNANSHSTNDAGADDMRPPLKPKKFNSNTLIPRVDNFASPLERTKVMLKPQVGQRPS